MRKEKKNEKKRVSAPVPTLKLDLGHTLISIFVVKFLSNIHKNFFDIFKTTKSTDVAEPTSGYSGQSLR